VSRRLSYALRALYALTIAVAVSLVAATTARAVDQNQFRNLVNQILAEPYQPSYTPAGFDSAFPADSANPAGVPNTAPAQDYTTGSIPGDPDAPNWPTSFKPVLLHSGDGAPLLGQLGLHPGRHPGLVVVHGFNTHGNLSIIRWATMLYANGYDVLAADQRDFSFEYSAGYGDPNWLQTFGWKESEDVVAAGRYLKSQPGVRSVGVMGVSEGGQNTVLALALDAVAGSHIFDAGLNFSGPADQDSQIYSTALPAGCQTPFCTYPVSEALIQLVVPPYSQGDPCTVLGRSAAYYHTDTYSILAHETAFHAQTRVKVPLLNFYAADDPLVLPFQATMMAGYGSPKLLQQTVEIQKGAHAYYYDRWWQQRAILLYFKGVLPGARDDKTVGTTPTVNQSSGGAPLSSQLVPLGSPTRAQADSYLAPFICDTSLPPPGRG
jgi:predicted alpha/beta-fold hydrolase